MVRVTKIVAVGLAGIGVVEIAFRGTDAALYAWYLLFVLWVVLLLIRFAMAAVDAYKTVFTKGPDGQMTFPECEKKMASFSRGGGREENGPSSTTTSGTGSQEGGQAICSMTSESTRSSGRMIRSGSFSTLEVVPYGYTSGEPRIQAVQHDKEPFKTDRPSGTTYNRLRGH